MNGTDVETPPPYAFISYVADDRAFAMRLAGALRSQGIAVWTDEANIAAGENWQQAVARGLREAAVLIHIASRHSDGSKVLSDQLSTFMAGPGRVIPVVVDDEGARAVPLALRDLPRVDARRGFDEAVQALGHDLAPLRRARPLPEPSATASGYVFISYAAENAAFVARLKAFMKARGYAYWDFLESARDYQSDFTHELEAVIQGARATVSVISPAWKRSRTALQELHFSWEAGTPVFLLEVEDPGPTLVLAGRTVIDFTTSIDEGFARLDAEFTRQGLPSTGAGTGPPVDDAPRHSRREPRVAGAAGVRRWGVAAGAAVVMATVTVPLWWSRADVPAATPVRPAAAVDRPAPAQAPPPAPTRRPVREVSVPYTMSHIADVRGDAAETCRSDSQRERALFRLESIGAWPATSGPRAREVQLVAVGEIEIEDASIAMNGGADAATVAQPRREIARKWLFAEPIAAPVVIVVCVRSRTPQAPQPAFRVSTWKEIAP